MADCGAAIPIQIPLKKKVDGGSIMGCPLVGGFPAGADGFPSCVQRVVNKGMEGE